jgi:enoyl-CoA hydratase/carnithine racemase
MSEPEGRTAGAGSPILVEDDGSVRRITFNRPEARNALNSRCYRLLAEALDSAAEDRSIKCVLVTGAGDHFCAGLDLRDDELEADDAWRVYDDFISRLEQFPKPLTAAVAGVAVGIGATMLGHFDLVFAGRSARFRLPFLSLGLSPEAGSTFTMPAAMGAQATAHALFTASWISAEEAAAAGLVWRLADDAVLLDEAAEECAQVAKMPVASLVATKELLLANKLGPTRSARQREEAEFRRLQAGPDHAEALAAFAERREPVF